MHVYLVRSFGILNLEDRKDKFTLVVTNQLAGNHYYKIRIKVKDCCYNHADEVTILDKDGKEELMHFEETDVSGTYGRWDWGVQTAN